MHIIYLTFIVGKSSRLLCTQIVAVHLIKILDVGYIQSLNFKKVEFKRKCKNKRKAMLGNVTLIHM